MRVKFISYSYDLESYDGQAAYYDLPSVRSYEAYGTVQGYIRDAGTTYAIVLTDDARLVEVQLLDLEVMKDLR